MSGYKPYNGQSYKKSSIFPKEWIKEKWDEDYDITEVAYGDGQWVVVMTGESGYYGQSWTTSSSFPEDTVHPVVCKAKLNLSHAQLIK